MVTYMRNVVVLALAVVTFNASAENLECKRYDGVIYQVKNRPLDLYCRVPGSQEPFSKMVRVQKTIPQFKSKPAVAARVKKVGRSAVLERLKDPTSAKFRNDFVMYDKAYCGEVLAKNSYGGYTGFDQFVSLGTAESTWFGKSTDGFAAIYEEFCTKEGRDEYEWITEP